MAPTYLEVWSRDLKQRRRTSILEWIPPLRITCAGSLLVLYRLKPKSLDRYKAVCGEDGCGSVPLCYLECLFMRSLVTLAVSSKCALAPLGLIHLKQTVTVYESLDDLLTLPFDLHTELLRYRQVDRGVEADIRLQVFKTSERCVWEGEVTVLSRNPTAQRSGEHKGVPDTTQTGDWGEVEVSVPGDTGVRYAQASGDWNPHHLYTWSARLLGYRRPIAHGMWTLAMALAQVHNTGVTPSFPIHIEASFKRPLFMPGVCLVRHGTTSSSMPSSRWVHVVDKTTGVPHLIATMAQLKQ